MYIISQNKQVVTNILDPVFIGDYNNNIFKIENKECYFGTYTSIEKAKKVLGNIVFYLKQDISNFIYELPQDDEIDDLKWEIINKDSQDTIIQTKLISQEYAGKLEIKLNEFLLKISNKKIIEIKYNTSHNPHVQNVLYTALIIYEDKVVKNKEIKKEDIIAVEIPSTDRKIYNIKEEIII